MKQPRERLFLGKQIAETDKGGSNVVLNSKNEHYRLSLQFQNTKEGVEQALENLGVVEARVSGERFVIWLGRETEGRTQMVRIMTKKELEAILNPPTKQKSNMIPARA